MRCGATAFWIRIQARIYTAKTTQIRTSSHMQITMVHMSIREAKIEFRSCWVCVCVCVDGWGFGCTHVNGAGGGCHPAASSSLFPTSQISRHSYTGIDPENAIPDS